MSCVFFVLLFFIVCILTLFIFACRTLLRHELEFSTSRKSVIKRLNKVRLDEIAETINDVYERNPYDSTRKEMWKEQCLLNFPLLYLASLVLYRHGQERGCNTYLFATRDGCHWFRIFKALFPDAKVHYFHCSRLMLENAVKKTNASFNKYVQSIIPVGDKGHLNISKMIYVDIHGTGQRMFS